MRSERAEAFKAARTKAQEAIALLDAAITDNE